MIAEQTGHFGILAARGAVAQMALQRVLFGASVPAAVDQPEGTLM
jgi:hypothetical protein